MLLDTEEVSVVVYMVLERGVASLKGLTAVIQRGFYQRPRFSARKVLRCKITTVNTCCKYMLSLRF